MTQSLWFYQLLDLAVTAIETGLLYLTLSAICPVPEQKWRKYLPLICDFAAVFMFSWVINVGVWKIPALILMLTGFTVLFWKAPVFQAASGVMIFFTVLPGIAETFTFVCGYLTLPAVSVVVEGKTVASWQIYLIAVAFKVAFGVLLRLLMKKGFPDITWKDFIVIGSLASLSLVTISYSSGNFSLGKIGWFDFEREVFSAILAAVFIGVFLYLKHYYALRDREKQEKLEITCLKQQYAYYQDKLKDEARVRAMYHDMKNYLLVLENHENAAQTREMAQTLRAQIVEYEDYVHTGNKFLDIIVKDKAMKAREKQIDFSAVIDLSGVEFIEPLDISTLFGNGLDNAIEASEKLPAAQRVILVKAGKVQSFISIVIENNCMEKAAQKSGRITKEDAFLHGFGISNMQKTAEKYGGVCTTAQESGKFTLKILIPIP